MSDNEFGEYKIEPMPEADDPRLSTTWCHMHNCEMSECPQ